MARRVKRVNALSCQISWRSVKLLPTYGDLTVCKMAAVRHFGLFDNAYAVCWKWKEDRKLARMTERASSGMQTLLLGCHAFRELRKSLARYVDIAAQQGGATA